eukprot:7333653-Ditylum_brightwellii.AAC.1
MSAASKKPIVSEQDALSKLFRFKQGPNMSNSIYFEKFSELIEIVKHLGTRLNEEDAKLIPILTSIAYNPLNSTNAEMREARKIASERYYAVMFLLHSDRKRYGGLVANLANAHTHGKDEYLTTMTDAYKYLVDFQTPTVVHNTPDEGGVAFYTDGPGRGHGSG